MNRVHFSSAKQDWKTPEAVYNALDDEFQFDFDPCPAHPTFDGLAVEWGQRCFVNPPYKEIAKWMQKAYSEWASGSLVVMLIPSRTDTRWWHDFVMKATEIRFIRGRLRFQGAKHNAPFPSAIIVFR